MGFASLGSGSRGNGTVVACGEEILLVDCGFTLKQCEQRLARLGLSAGDLTAILVTHEHADHMSGVAPLAHKYSIPVYASFGTARKLSLSCHRFDGDVIFNIGNVQVHPVRVPHDAHEPTQFVLHGPDEKIGVLSDLGAVTQHVIEQYRDCTLLMMEANHDAEMLRVGSYPPALKRRVAARYGHLSNAQAVEFLDAVANPELHVVIGHISEQNNSLPKLETAFAAFGTRLGSLRFATQSEGFDWIGPRPLLRQHTFSEVL